MRTIAIINQKGGSGKTTTTVNLAATLAEKERSVLIIDIDPQGSLTSWFGISREEKGLFNVFVNNANIVDIVAITDNPNLSVIPASNWLFGVEKALASEVGAETILRQQCKKLEKNGYDYILIDCPPNLGILTVNALTAVQEIIIPVETRVMALSGLVQLMQTIDIIKQRLNKNLRIAGIVPCRFDARTKHAREVVDALKSNFKGMLYQTAIRENIRLSEAPSFTQAMTDYDTKSYGAFDYRELAKEVIKQEQPY